MVRELRQLQGEKHQSQCMIGKRHRANEVTFSNPTNSNIVEFDDDREWTQNSLRKCWTAVEV